MTQGLDRFLLETHGKEKSEASMRARLEGMTLFSSTEPLRIGVVLTLVGALLAACTPSADGVTGELALASDSAAAGVGGRDRARGGRRVGPRAASGSSHRGAGRRRRGF